MGEVMEAVIWREPQRRRLVGLCAAVTGDRDAAEDLAQETLLEAWRNAHKLRDPAGADRWLAAIARNVCRRWARRRGRDVVLAPIEAEPAAEGATHLELELELERAELVDLLDRALALLPTETRDVLIDRYVHESSHGEIAARLGISEDAVSMRLSRGKLVLRRVLGSELRDEAAAHGLFDAEDDGWRDTRVWCTRCGQRKLVVRRAPPPGELSFRCPGCEPDPSVPDVEVALGNPSLARLVRDVSRPAAILSRVSAWSGRYFGPGKGARVACTRCGRTVALQSYFGDEGGRRGASRHVLFAECGACGEQLSSSIVGLGLALPEVRRFRREHPRTRLLPERYVEAGGVAAIVVTHQAVLGSARADVVFARDTLRVLEVHGATA